MNQRFVPETASPARGDVTWNPDTRADVSQLPRVRRGSPSTRFLPAGEGFTPPPLCLGKSKHFQELHQPGSVPGTPNLTGTRRGRELCQPRSGHSQPPVSVCHVCHPHLSMFQAGDVSAGSCRWLRMTAGKVASPWRSSALRQCLLGTKVRMVFRWECRILLRG